MMFLREWGPTILAVAVAALLGLILFLGFMQLFGAGPYSAADFYTCDDLRPRGC